MPRRLAVNKFKDFRTWSVGELSSRFDPVIRKSAPVIETKIKALIREKLNKDQAIQSLLDFDLARNSLKKQFGLTDAEAVASVDLIIDSVIESIRVVSIGSQKNKNIISGISVNILPENLLRQLADTISYISKPSGSEIKWLDWLLFRGLEVTVSGWTEKLTNQKTRAGAIMIKDGGYYRVDSRFAGAQEDNFITRILEQSADEIVTIIRTSIPL